MKRKQFIQHGLLLAGGVFGGKRLLAKAPEKVYGHNEKKYQLNTNWGKLDATANPVNDCHEMVQDGRGRILLLTNETRNNILAYDKSGKLLAYWGTEYPGAHGLTLQRNGREDFLFITDTQLHQVYKTIMDGRKLITIDAPLDAGIYQKKEEFVPTETTVLPN
ncbi:MAG: 6-bladed beta-propeller, partial [Bacteroidota bacterium]